MDESGPEGKTIETKIPARLDRLPWSKFHWLVVIGLGTVWILDGLEVTIVGSIGDRLTEKGSGITLDASQIGTAAAFYVVAWYQGRSEWGPRALGRRSLLANPCNPANLERLNEIKGREQFQPPAPLVLESRAGEIFDGPVPSPYTLFTHRVRAGWAGRIPTAVHVDGTARVQTVAPTSRPLLARMLAGFEGETGVPVVVNAGFNTGGRPLVDSPRDALECFGSAPIDVLAIGPFLVERSRFFPDGDSGAAALAATG